MIFDSELSFIPHIKNITKIGFYHLMNIARVRPFLSQASTEVLMHAFISCRLDYCNTLLSGLPKKSIFNLQLLQNSATRVLTRTRGREHITPVLKSLHWLPVHFRINFKVLLLVFRCLNGLRPSYLSDLLLSYQPSRTLRSSGPAFDLKHTGRRLLVIMAPDCGTACRRTSGPQRLLMFLKRGSSLTFLIRLLFDFFDFLYSF